MFANEKVLSLYPKGRIDVNREAFVPRLISWNTTFACNLRCPHCYLDAGEVKRGSELSTLEGKKLIDQITEVSKPLLIFSGGEPLLRKDIFELAQYATKKGLKTAIGTNGTLISPSIAERLLSSGVKVVAISIDSTLPERHDGFRGVKGSWAHAMTGIELCIRNGIDVQVNTTVTQQNFHEIDKILDLAEEIGARSFHLFFLVPTGRGVIINDISAEKYESMIEAILDKITDTPSIKVRPVCAPQFLRIATQKGMDLKTWGYGCLAGRTYCRIYPTGEVTPCPYLPINLGNIRKTDFKDIWLQAPVFNALRDHSNLIGKCGRCEFRELCGGCRARAYGLKDSVNICGGLRQPEELQSDYLAEDPWCLYQPVEG